MAKNLVDSEDIKVSVTGEDLQLNISNKIKNMLGADPVVNSMDGNEIDKSPNVNAIKNFITGFEMGDNYIKFDNGILICWGQKKASEVSVTNQWGGVYSSGPNVQALKFNDFPIPFVEVPIITYTSLPDYNNSWFMADDSMKPTKNNPGGVQLLRGTANTGVGVILNYLAIGKWK